MRLTKLAWFRKLWGTGMSCTLIAKTMGIGRRSAQRYPHECGLHPRPVGRPKKYSNR